MANAATRADFVNMVAEEVSCGIERALEYWLGLIELKVTDQRLTTEERISAIKRILTEYKATTGNAEFGCASA